MSNTDEAVAEKSSVLTSLSKEDKTMDGKETAKTNQEMFQEFIKPLTSKVCDESPNIHKKPDDTMDQDEDDDDDSIANLVIDEDIAVLTKDVTKPKEKTHREFQFQLALAKHKFRVRKRMNAPLSSPLKHLYSLPQRNVKPSPYARKIWPIVVTSLDADLSNPEDLLAARTVDSFINTDDEEVSVVEPNDPLASVPSISSFDKLGKFGTTLKKVRVSPNDPISLHTLNPEPELTIKMGESPFHCDLLASIAATKKQNQKIVSEYMKRFKKSNNALVENILRKSTTGQAATPSSSKPSEKQTFKKVRLQKSSNGLYEIMNEVAPIVEPATPQNFPKAILYPDYTKQKSFLSDIDPKPSTSKMVTIKSKQPHQQAEVDPHDAAMEEFLNNPTSSPPTVINDGNSTLKVRPLHELQVPPREPSPEPVKYVIPQDMLFSTTDKVKPVVKPSSQSEDVHNVGEYKFNELFVLESETDAKKAKEGFEAAGKNRRKTTLVPKKDEDDVFFEEAPFLIPQRPQANIDLIENLAMYRVLVSHMLKKLNMPQVNFSEDGDDFINMYKIYRN